MKTNIACKKLNHYLEMKNETVQNCICKNFVSHKVLAT